MPKDIRYMTLMGMYSEAAKSIPFFASKGKSFISYILSKLSYRIEDAYV